MEQHPQSHPPGTAPGTTPAPGNVPAPGTPQPPPTAWPPYSPYAPHAAPPPVPVVGLPASRVWSVILATLTALCVLGLFIMQNAGPAPADEDEPLAAGAPNFILHIQARYVVGVGQLLSTMPNQDHGETLTQLSDQLSQVAVTPADRVRVITVMGELLGHKEALTQLDSFRETWADSVSDDVKDDVDTLAALYAHGRDALTDEQQQDLIDDYDWFGRLALVHDQPAGSSERQAVMAPTLRTVVGMLGIVMGGGAASIAGLVLLIIALVHVSQRRFRWAYAWQHPSAVVNRSPYLEAFILFLLGVPALGILADRLSDHVPHAVAIQVVWLLLLLPVWIRLRGVPWSTMCAGLGWHKGRGVIREVFAGVFGYMAGLPLLIAGLIVTLILAQFMHLFVPPDAPGIGAEQAGAPGPAPTPGPVHPVVYELSHVAPWQLMLLGLLLAGWAPIVEETLFRGALYHVMRRRWSIFLSATATGFMFAAIHPQGVLGIPPLMALGATFAFLREWRGSIIAPITAHALNNGMIFVLFVMVAR